MTLRQLKYIIKIVESGSITEAAKQLFITQPSLSNAVKELETELGIEIFNRSAKGISLTVDGAEFLSYARQVEEQAALLEQRYKGRKPSRQLCAVSTQHYAFSVDAFVDLVKDSPSDEYEFTLRETRTYDIIQDVSNLRSEIGVLYLNKFNEKVIMKLLRENHLVFHPLFEAKPHVFISAEHPLAVKEIVTLEELADIKTAVSEAVTNAIIHGYENLAGYSRHGESIPAYSIVHPGKVRMHCVLDGDMLSIEITDQGKGIEDIKKAMEPLFTTKPELDRSGMGFAFMEAFMDDLEVESTPGKGTRVHMRKKMRCGDWIGKED